MKIVFAGTPEFAARALAALHAAGHEIVLVLTQPDRPAGRGMQMHASPVKQFAATHGIPVAQPQSLRINGKFPEQAGQALALLQATPHDVMVVAAYGLILPQAVLDIPRYGCLNIHASLLPRWRGAAPIQRAIEAGDAQSGITIMQMDAGLDTGAMIATGALTLAADETTASLHDRLAVLGAQMIVDTLAQLDGGTLQSTPQPEAGVCYAEKITKDEAQLDFRLGAEVLERKIRALNPAPGAVAQFPDLTVKIWSAAPEPDTATLAPGALQLRGKDLLVGCGTGALRLLELQKPGSKRMPVAEFLKGYHPETPA